MRMETPSAQAQQPQSQPPFAVPHQGIYINGFGLGLTSGDVYIILMRNGVNLGILNLSFTVAKSLGEGLQKVMADFEKDTGHHIMTSLDVTEALDKKQSAPKEV